MRMMRSIKTLLTGGTFFEGPRWRDGRWWVSDFFRHRVIAVDPSGQEEQVLEVPQQPSGLGWLPDGSLLVASMRDHRLLRRAPDGSVTVHADLTPLCGGWLNDIVVDATGRAWCGNFGFDFGAAGGGEQRTANLIRVDPDGSVHLAAGDLMFPNGSVVTPDGRTLIVGESFASRYAAFTVGDDGALKDRRIWADMPGVFPDGCCLDTDGRIWCADPNGRRIVCVAQGGAIVEEIAMPDGMTSYACMIGGADGKTLLMACKPPGSAIQAVADAVLMTTTVEVSHAGLP
jgi:sugar lactone lactonase YvrE